MPTILVVDDEPEVLRLLEIMFHRAGFAVLKAESGQECLRLLRQQNPDVIVLDNMMPRMSGLQVLESMHAIYQGLAQPPVIMLSAKGGMEAMLEALQAGVYKYLVKPTPRDKMMEVVRAALADSQKNRQPDISPDDWR